MSVYVCTYSCIRKCMCACLWKPGDKPKCCYLGTVHQGLSLVFSSQKGSDPQRSACLSVPKCCHYKCAHHSRFLMGILGWISGPKKHFTCQAISSALSFVSKCTLQALVSDLTLFQTVFQLYQAETSTTHKTLPLASCWSIGMCWYEALGSIPSTQ